MSDTKKKRVATKGEITKQQNVDYKLEAGDILQLVLNNIPQFIFWKDLNSVYLGCNKNFAKVAGVEKPEDINGKTDHDLPWNESEADFFRECDRRVMDTNIPEYHIVEPQYQADGKQAWLDTNKVPLHDISGDVIGMLGTYEDITERIEFEKELTQHRDHLEELVKKRTKELLDANAVLKKALGEVQTLSGLLPICSSCKGIRDDKGYWTQIESYISDHSEAEFSHSICPDCAKKLYPDDVDESGNILPP